PPRRPHRRRPDGKLGGSRRPPPPPDRQTPVRTRRPRRPRPRHRLRRPVVSRVNPSPEIVTLPRRPHIAAWGDTVAWPGLFLLVGGSLVALAMWLFFRREPEAQAAIWVGGSGVILLAAFVITLVNAI